MACSQDGFGEIRERDIACGGQNPELHGKDQYEHKGQQEAWNGLNEGRHNLQNAVDDPATNRSEHTQERPENAREKYGAKTSDKVIGRA